MYFVTILAVGFLAGLSAGKAFVGRGFGVVGDVFLGVLGALIGGSLFSNLGGLVLHGTWNTVLAGTAGSVLLLALFYSFWGPRHVPILDPGP